MLGQKLLTAAAAVLGFGLLVAGRTIPPSFQHLEERVSESLTHCVYIFVVKRFTSTSKIPSIKVMDSSISLERMSKTVS